MRVLGLDPGDHLTGGVGRGVVDDDDLLGGHRLVQHRFQAPLKDGFFVVGRDHHRGTGTTEALTCRHVPVVGALGGRPRAVRTPGRVCRSGCRPAPG